MTIHQLRHVRVEHEDSGAAPGDVEPHQGAVLGVKVGPDLEILRGVPIMDRDFKCFCFLSDLS